MCDDLVGTGEQHRATGASGKTGEEPSQQRRGIYSGGKASENKFTMKYREKRFFPGSGIHKYFHNGLVRRWGRGMNAMKMSESWCVYCVWDARVGASVFDSVWLDFNDWKREGNGFF